MAGMTADAPHAAGPGWSSMTMGLARLQYNRQGGPSGDSALESSNWSMAMAQRPLLSGTLTLMMMNSLEPATFRGGGMPQLFQTGRRTRAVRWWTASTPTTCHEPVATWRRPMEKRAGVGTGGAVGGRARPAAFMHARRRGRTPPRPSAPLARLLAHHAHGDQAAAPGAVSCSKGPLSTAGSPRGTLGTRRRRAGSYARA